MSFQRSRAGLFIKKIMDDQTPNLAALLAWGALSALLPLLLGILSLAGLILRDPQTLDKVYGVVVGALPQDAAGPVTQVIDNLRQGSAAPAGIVAIVLLLVTGSGFFANMAFVFNQAYYVQGRNPIVERLIALGMVVVTAVLLILSSLAAGISSLVTNLPGVLPIGPLLAELVGWSVQIISAFVMFLLIYRVLPNVRQSVRDVVPGAVLSTVLSLVVSQVFPIYVKLFPPNQAYAAFGVFLVLTFWLYVVGFVFVLGAALNAFLQERAPVPEPAAVAESARTGAQPASHGGVAAHFLCFLGLIVAVLLLRKGDVKTRTHA